MNVTFTNIVSFGVSVTRERHHKLTTRFTEVMPITEQVDPDGSMVLPASSHYCWGLRSLRCDDPNNRSTWKCQLASCSSCVDFDWNLFCAAQTTNGTSLASRKVRTTMRDLEGLPKRDVRFARYCARVHYLSMLAPQ